MPIALQKNADIFTLQMGDKNSRSLFLKHKKKLN